MQILDCMSDDYKFDSIKRFKSQKGRHGWQYALPAVPKHIISKTPLDTDLPPLQDASSDELVSRCAISVAVVVADGRVMAGG